MLALTTTAGAPHLALAQVPDPAPQPAEAIVRVRAVSLNGGEIEDLPQRPHGALVGWDLAGVVAI